MKISRAWLQTFFDRELPPDLAIADALMFHAFEIDGMEANGSDTVFEVKVTPNRGHDALSHRGIAHELSGILDLEMKDDPLSGDAAAAGGEPKIAISLESPELSPRFMAAHIEGVEVRESPEWLRARLEAIGERSINNIVDATNYVMYHLGQPLHAYDADALQEGDGGYEIAVRRARAGEKLRALDGTTYDLSDSMLVIADGHADVPIGIAGIKGGEAAGIRPETKRIILEAANFDGPTVRRASRALSLRTDASDRFQQGLSPELTSRGMQAALALIGDIAGGTLLGIADQYPTPQRRAWIDLSINDVNARLGTSFDAGKIEDALRRLGFEYEKGAGYRIDVPVERLDLSGAEDMVEEIARIIGYDVIPESPLPPFSASREGSARFALTEYIRQFLLDEGFTEVITSAFSASGARAVLNKVDSNLPYLRSALAPGIGAALERNMLIREAVGVSEVRLFEIGVVWGRDTEEMHLAVGISGGKKSEKPEAVLTRLLSSLERADVPIERAGAVAEIHVEQLVDEGASLQEKTYPISNATRYQPFSRYPFIVRDIAMWVPEGATEERAVSLIREHAGELLRRIYLFDRYEKDGRLSLAYRLVFQSFDRTLFDEDANRRMDAVSAALKAEGYEIR